MTFNTENERKLRRKISIVLNLIINGWPSILEGETGEKIVYFSFKPYYKWMTFNTTP